MKKILSRDTDRQTRAEVSVIRVYEEDSEELIAELYHDEPMHIPSEGDLLRLQYVEGIGDGSEILEKGSENSYEVTKREFAYQLNEWEDGGTEKDTIMCVVDLIVE